MLEAKLLREAKKRGVDPERLKAEARNLALPDKCIKSIF